MHRRIVVGHFLEWSAVHCGVNSVPTSMNLRPYASLELSCAARIELLSMKTKEIIPCGGNC
jgi:hypothetical protein